MLKINKHLAVGREFYRSRQVKIGSIILVIVFAFLFIGPLFISYSPYSTAGRPYLQPSWSHIFGTDFQGHDLSSEIIWGAYTTLEIVLIAAVGSTLLGFFVGIFNGYFDRIGHIFGGATDIIMTFPLLPLLLIGILFLTTTPELVSLLVIFLWAPVERAIRAQVMAVKKLPYVEAARTSGLDYLRMIFRVIVPEVVSIGMAFFIVNLTIMTGLTTSLEFLGLGNPTIVSWDSILYCAQQYAFFVGAW